MDSTPLVSILIPCWGCRDFIRETIESALAQDYPNFEVVVVEDCGTDGTYEEACKITDARLRVIRNEQNRGQYGNKNAAVAHARGELVKYLDGDDLLEPDALTTLVRAYVAAGPGVGIVFASHRGIDARGHITVESFRWGLEGRVPGRTMLDWVTKRKIGASCFGNVSPHLFRTDLLREIPFPDDNAGPGDLETYLKQFTRADVVFVEKSTARYRTHESAMSKRTFGLRESRDYVQMIDRVIAWLAANDTVPPHLADDAFVKSWKLEASAHQILPSLQHKIRRRPSQFDEIRSYYAGLGMGREFDRFVAMNFASYLVHSAGVRLRRAFKRPAMERVFEDGLRGVT